MVGAISMLLSFGFLVGKRISNSSNGFLYAGRSFGLALSGLERHIDMVLIMLLVTAVMAFAKFNPADVHNGVMAAKPALINLIGYCGDYLKEGLC